MSCYLTLPAPVHVEVLTVGNLRMDHSHFAPSIAFTRDTDSPLILLIGLVGENNDIL